MLTDKMHVVHPCAAGLDVHKMEITATVRLCSPEGGDPETETEAFGTLESGMRDLVAWLRGHGVTAAAMEATGLGASALEDAGIHVDLLHAQHVKQGPENGCRRQHVAGLPVRSGGSESGPAARVPASARAESSSATDDRRLRPTAQPRSQDPGPRRHRRGALGRVRRQRDAHPSRNGRRRAAGGNRRVPSCCGQTRYAKPLPTTSPRTVGKFLATCCHDYASQKIACYDKLIREGLDGFEKQLLLLQTIPGIDRESACAILIGPDIGVFGSALRRLVRRVPRQRQKRRQAAQRTKP